MRGPAASWRRKFFDLNDVFLLFLLVSAAKELSERSVRGRINPRSAGKRRSLCGGTSGKRTLDR